MKMERLVHDLIEDSLISDRMILLTGPRQTGKTTEAKAWLGEGGHEHLYYNWDDEKVRREFRRDPNFFETRMRAAGRGARIVFDEIHKLTNWKTVLKGYYDSFGNEFNFMVTGSARLELFQRSGDSMFGRYHLLHMSPITPNEAENNWSKPNVKLDVDYDVLSQIPPRPETIETLLRYSGFPEPFLKQSDRALNIWHGEYNQRIMKEDLRDLTKISDFNRIEHAVDLLPLRVGSPFSLNNLKEDLGCAYDTARTVIKSLEKLYVLMLLRPYSRNIKYAIGKEPKIYFYDWTRISDEGAHFENFIAVQLRTFCDFINDGGWARLGLYYIRDRQGHETDFLITLNEKPKLLIEAKISEDKLDSNLRYFSEKMGNVHAIQVVLKPDLLRKVSENICIVSANRFFNLLWTT